MEITIFFSSLGGLLALLLARFSWMRARKELKTQESTPYYRGYMRIQKFVAKGFMRVGGAIRGYFHVQKKRVRGSVVKKAAAFVHKHGIYGREFHINREHKKDASQYLKDVTLHKEKMEKKK